MAWTNGQDSAGEWSDNGTELTPIDAGRNIHISGDFIIDDSDDSHSVTITVGNFIGNRTLTIPSLSLNADFVFHNATQTITNKTIDADDNTIVVVNHGNTKLLISDAAGSPTALDDLTWTVSGVIHQLNVKNTNANGIAWAVFDANGDTLTVGTSDNSDAIVSSSKGLQLEADAGTGSRVQLLTAYTDVSKPFRFAPYTDGTRPAATSVPAGSTIWNTSDAQLNISDGTNWTLPDGSTT
jgi:hypothetical protein